MHSAMDNLRMIRKSSGLKGTTRTKKRTVSADSVPVRLIQPKDFSQARASSALIRRSKCNFCRMRIPLRIAHYSVRGWLCSEVIGTYRLISESAKSGASAACGTPFADYPVAEMDSRKDGFMMTKRLMFVLGSVALLAVFSLAADQPPQCGGRMMGGMGGLMRGMGGGMMGGMRGMMGCSFDFSKQVPLYGTVESVAVAQGQGFPHFVLALSDGTKVTVVTAPFRAVLNAKYTIAVGELMSVVAFPSTQYADVFGAAVLTNGQGAVLTLRDASGAPVAHSCQRNCPNR
jgi:hypothetical protein